MTRSRASGASGNRATLRRILSVRMTAGTGELARLHEAIEALEASEGLGADVVADMQIVLDEVLSNAAKHGSTTSAISVTIARDRQGLVIAVEDDGVAFDPLAVPPPDQASPLDERAVGGLGVHLVRRLMDETRYERRRGRNRLLMRRRLPPRSA